MAERKGGIAQNTNVVTLRMKNEWEKIIWPGKEQVKTMTVAAVAVAAMTAVFSAVIDSGMVTVLGMILGN